MNVLVEGLPAAHREPVELDGAGRRLRLPALRHVHSPPPVYPPSWRIHRIMNNVGRNKIQ
jgi:hypothetical protein